MPSAKSGTTDSLAAAVEAVRELQKLGATHVEITAEGGVVVELAAPAGAKGKAERPLSARDRKRLADLEDQARRLEEIPGMRMGKAV